MICGFPRHTELLCVSTPVIKAGTPDGSVGVVCGMALHFRLKCSPPGDTVLCRDECWSAPVWWKYALLSSPESGQFLLFSWASLASQTVKNLLAMQETWVRSLGREYPLEKEMATHYSILARKFHGQRRLAGPSPQCHKESDTT